MSLDLHVLPPHGCTIHMLRRFMFGVFGILGTQLYMGRTSRCNQNTFANGTTVVNKSMVRVATALFKFLEL